MTAKEFYDHEFNHGLSPHFSKTTYIGDMHPKAYIEKGTAMEFAESYHNSMSEELGNTIKYWEKRAEKLEKRYKTLKDKNAEKGREIKEIEERLNKAERYIDEMEGNHHYL